MTRVGSADSGTSSDQLEGGGATPTSALQKAHQRVIRERRAREDSDADLFGRWWQGIDLDIGRARVREISYVTAEKVTLEYEWLGSMPAVVWRCFGIYFDGHLGGVAIYGPEYSENLGVWDRYGFTGKMILLSRGACVHWAHPHAGSRLIRQSMRMLDPKYEIVTATVDPAAGEIGTLYQACGFHFVGAMAEISMSGPRTCLVLPNGSTMHERQVRQKYGGLKPALAAIKGSRLQEVAKKGRYFAFRGAATAHHCKAISHLLKPYPKRAAA